MGQPLHSPNPRPDLRLLLVEDSQSDASALLDHLIKWGVQPRHLRVESEPDYERALSEGTWDLIIADYSMPGFSGHRALELLKKKKLDIPFLFLSGTLSQAGAAAAIAAGASEFIPKGNLDRLGPAIERAFGGPRSALIPTRGSDLGTTEKRTGSPKVPVPSAPPIVLLVDDREENLTALGGVLEGLGAKFVRASSGRDALALLMKVEPACILLDIRMPEMDGLETAHLIKARMKSRHVPILFLTANFDSAEEIERIYEMGAADYIPKPFIPALLRSKVQVFLDLWQRTEDLRVQMAKVEALNRELGEFTAAVSHDLRAPLRAITRSSQVLLVDYAPQLDDAGKLFAHQIEDSARRMDAFVSELLEYANLDRENYSLGPIGMEEVARDVLAELDQAIKSCGGCVTLEGPFFMAQAHPTALKQVLRNLVMNGLKFVELGHKPVLTLRSEHRSDRIRLWVEDNGIGIDPAEQKKIFEPFVQLNGQHLYPGSGLGLAIVRRAVIAMLGDCGCESKLGHGSRFWVDLPEG